MFKPRTLKAEVERVWENKQYLLRELTRGKIAFKEVELENQNRMKRMELESKAS